MRRRRYTNAHCKEGRRHGDQSIHQHSARSTTWAASTLTRARWTRRRRCTIAQSSGCQPVQLAYIFTCKARMRTWIISCVEDIHSPPTILDRFTQKSLWSGRGRFGVSGRNDQDGFYCFACFLVEDVECCNWSELEAVTWHRSGQVGNHTFESRHP